MSGAELLQEKFAALLAWDKSKRRKENLAATGFYAAIAALAALPFPLTLMHRLLMIVAVFASCLLFQTLRRRRRPRDDLRAVAQVDRALRLEERAVTAWEMLAARQSTAPAALVIAQAAERLKNFDAKATSPRKSGWKERAILPLFGFWIVLVALGVGTRIEHRQPGNRGLAYEARQFSRELQEKAKREGLQASLKLAQDLQKAAQRTIDEKLADEPFQKELAGLAKTAAAMGKPAPGQRSAAGGESDQTLKDLRAELESALDFLSADRRSGGESGLDQEWLERLSMLPQLKKYLGNDASTMARGDAKSFLQRLESQVNGELDRRSLLEAQQFLEQLAKQRGEKGEGDTQVAAGGGQEAAKDFDRGSGESNLPGKEPGKSPSGERSLPAFAGGSAAQVKGMLNPGGSEGLVFKGKPTPGKPETSQDDVFASYRRQAEAELNTEKVPDALKETVRNYFLSLENGAETGGANQSRR